MSAKPARARCESISPSRIASCRCCSACAPSCRRRNGQGKDFASAADEPIIGSGPYVIDGYEPGRFIEFRRNADWWGRGLPINRGLNNFDRIRFEYFRNQDALWEAVKGGGISIFADYDPVRWAEGYDFPAVPRAR